MDDNYTFVINGEIYLKRGPEPFNPGGMLDDIIGNLEFETSKENPNLNLLKYLPDFKSFKDRVGELDYSGTDDFWQLNTNGRCFEIICYDFISPEIRRYTSLNELNKDFVKLSEFLEMATFVGREFTRTIPIETSSGKEDKSFMKLFDFETEKYIVLYATQELFLVKHVGFVGHEDKYILINSRYTIDGNYKFFGPVYKEYYDKKKVYFEILNQVSEKRKSKKRKGL